MLRPPKARPPSVPIPATEAGLPLVKSPGSYTSPDNTKASLFGNGVSIGKDQSTDIDYSRMDPDDMFVRYSVAEIRAIRARLLTDADGKREELRQMVGERYRDLLHASTAITNMAGTSERVVGTLMEMRESCTGILRLDESPKLRQRSMPNGRPTKAQEDAHLKTLQVLSAHLKLLLDSPEHLWRWLEKKQFLHAAWLFLLARTVYRKLSKSPDGDESEEEEAESGDINWLRHGIDVTEQFPIASRQWEAIGQFRPQIVHKATQALRESNMPHREIAETLVAILLLDALSTSRTRSLFLSQRSKTLTTLLNPPLSTVRRSISPSRAQNRKATAALLSPAASPSRSLGSPAVQLLKTPASASAANVTAERKAVREVVKTFRAVINLIGGTVAATQVIYSSDGLFAQLIADIQTDVSSLDLPSTASQPQFPTQLPTQITRSLSTPQILCTLPSASLLLRFLPPSIIGYTPYLSSDTDASGSANAEGMENELNSWLSNALEALAAPARTWLSKLDSVRAVWAVRGSTVRGIASLEGSNEVKERLSRAVESAFASRVAEVWENRLENIEIAVGGALKRAITLLESSSEGNTTREDVDPLAFVYSSELPPVRAEASGDAGFLLFEAALKRRVNRRTPLLDSVLSEMEATARELRDELIITTVGDTSNTINDLTSTYQPRAGETCMRVVNAVSKALDDAMIGEAGEKDNISTFVGRLANALITHSSFIKDLSCSEDTIKDVNAALKDVHRKSLRLWCTHSSENALKLYQPAFDDSPSKECNNIATILRPSNRLMSALTSLMSSIDSLGMTLEELRAEQVPQLLLDAFEGLVAAGTPVEHAPDQVVWDLMFLKEMQQVLDRSKDAENPERWVSSNDVIGSHLKECSEETQKAVKSAIHDQLARSQLLFSTLLDAHVSAATKPAQSRAQNAFLPLGVPPSETDFRSALELVKPCQRFGMLPITATQAR